MVRGVVDRMRNQAGVQLRLAVEAFVARDPALGAALPDMDDVMDDLQRDLFQVVFTLGAPDEAGRRGAIQITLLGRYFERIGDHALNIADRVEFMVTGQRHDAVVR